MRKTFKYYRNNVKKLTPEQKTEIVNYYLAGNSCAEIGKLFEVSHSTVLKVLEDAGVERRKRGQPKGIPSGAKGKTWQVSHPVRKPNLKGDKNPNWKGGSTALIHAIKNLPEYSFWRMEVFKRDNWTCQKCGAKNRKGERHVFDAHHLIPISKIVTDFGIKTIEDAISCKELWNVENGQCLCRDCHKTTDSWGVNKSISKC